MNRTEFADRISFCQRELEFLMGYDTGCKGCSKFQDSQCKEFGAIPEDYAGNDCPSWFYDDVPF